jgi:uncharacterized protein (TIGR02996 family)
MDTEGAFLRDVADAPNDPARRLAFADWLESQGRYAEATGQRWRAQHRNPDIREAAAAKGLPSDLQLGTERVWLWLDKMQFRSADLKPPHND